MDGGEYVKKKKKRRKRRRKRRRRKKKKGEEEVGHLLVRCESVGVIDCRFALNTPKAMS